MGNIQRLYVAQWPRESGEVAEADRRARPVMRTSDVIAVNSRSRIRLYAAAGARTFPADPLADRSLRPSSPVRS
jgi:hypothetical protein